MLSVSRSTCSEGVRLKFPAACALAADKLSYWARCHQKFVEWHNCHPKVLAWKGKAKALERGAGRLLSWPEQYHAGRSSAEYKAWVKWRAEEFKPRKRAMAADGAKFTPVYSRDTSEEVVERDCKIIESAMMSDKWDPVIPAVGTWPKMAPKAIPPDPVEDTGDYTQIDPGSVVTATTAAKFTIADMDRDMNAGAYIDHGADYWAGDWDWRMKTRVSASSAYNAVCFAMATTNSTDNLVAIDAASGSWLGVWLQDKTTYIRIRTYECAAGTLYYTTNVTTSYADTDYWLDYERDDNGGGSSVGQMAIEIYTDAYTTLQETVALDLHAQVDYRYVWWASSYNDSNSGINFDGTLEDFDLQGGGPTPPGGDIAVLRRRRSA